MTVLITKRMRRTFTTDATFRFLFAALMYDFCFRNGILPFMKFDHVQVDTFESTSRLFAGMPNPNDRRKAQRRWRKVIRTLTSTDPEFNKVVQPFARMMNDHRSRSDACRSVCRRAMLNAAHDAIVKHVYTCTVAVYEPFKARSALEASAMT